MEMIERMTRLALKQGGVEEAGEMEILYATVLSGFNFFALLASLAMFIAVFLQMFRVVSRFQRNIFPSFFLFLFLSL